MKVKDEIVTQKREKEKRTKEKDAKGNKDQLSTHWCYCSLLIVLASAILTLIDNLNHFTRSSYTVFSCLQFFLSLGVLIILIGRRPRFFPSLSGVIPASRSGTGGFQTMPLLAGPPAVGSGEEANGPVVLMATQSFLSFLSILEIRKVSTWGREVQCMGGFTETFIRKLFRIREQFS